MAPDVQEKLELVSKKIAEAARRAGRDAAQVRLVVVTKTHPVEVVKEVITAGGVLLGENRVQEAVPKIEAIHAAGLAGDVQWHLIGHLQSNKAKLAVANFDLIHSVHSAELADTLNRHAGAMGIRRDILLQVNISGEDTKSGIDLGDAEAGAKHIIDQCGNLRLAGLMTMAPLVGDPEDARPVFRGLRELSRRLQASAGIGPELSMGMTNDYEVAVEEGATLVRVGSAILGNR